MSNTAKKLRLEHVQTTLRPTYGGQVLEVEYELTTTQNNIQNVYTLTAEVRGIATAEPYMNLLTCEPQTNNEETLTFDAINDLLDW